MNNVNWDDNARAAVECFTDWLAGQDYRDLTTTEMLGRFVSSVALSPTQTKTVADAVGHPHFKATRENLENIAKDFQYFEEVEQEGEKWTHTYFDVRCRKADLDADDYGNVAIFRECGSLAIAHPSYLKPIKPKPKLTVNQYDACAKMASHFNINPSEFDEYMSKFESELTND